jgi:leucyl/phenylalanyl-tRNA--protein transferase
MQVRLLDNNLEFPPVTESSEEGLLAVGGDLSPARLLAAYEHGVFPWYNPGEMLMWWSPPQRAIIPLDGIRIHKSMRNELNKQRYTISYDTCFRDVVIGCAQASRGTDIPETWIGDDIIDGYTRLHELGMAHSVEVKSKGKLVGGLYGVSIGRMFFGESMFSTAPNASKVALINLGRKLKSWGFGPIDCQIMNDHLTSLGAVSIPRDDFQKLLDIHLTSAPTIKGSWNDV